MPDETMTEWQQLSPGERRLVRQVVRHLRRATKPGSVAVGAPVRYAGAARRQQLDHLLRAGWVVNLSSHAHHLLCVGRTRMLVGVTGAADWAVENEDPLVALMEG